MSAGSPSGAFRSRSGRKAITPLWVLEANLLTPGEFMILVALIAHADGDTGECFPSARTLSRITHQALRTCHNAVQKFQRIGLVDVAPQYRASGGQTSNLYTWNDIPTPEVLEKIAAYRAQYAAEDAARSGRGSTPTPQSAGGATPHNAGAPTPDSAANNNPSEQPKKRTKTPRPGTAGAKGTARNTRGRSSAAPPREDDSPPTSGSRSTASPAALALLAQLPRPWHEVAPWLRLRLAAKLDEYMVEPHGYGPAAIRRAVEAYAPNPVKVSDGRQNPDKPQHLSALARAMKILAVDASAGACRVCGTEHDRDGCEPFTTGPAESSATLLHLVPGACIGCDSTEATLREDAAGAFVCNPCWEIVAAGGSIGEAA